MPSPKVILIAHCPTWNVGISPSVEKDCVGAEEQRGAERLVRDLEMEQACQRPDRVQPGQGVGRGVWGLR